MTSQNVYMRLLTSAPNQIGPAREGTSERERERERERESY